MSRVFSFALFLRTERCVPRIFTARLVFTFSKKKPLMDYFSPSFFFCSRTAKFRSSGPFTSLVFLVLIAEQNEMKLRGKTRVEKTTGCYDKRLIECILTKILILLLKNMKPWFLFA